MFSSLFNDQPVPRYEKQLRNVDELVLHTIRDKKGVIITKKELYLVLESLYEWRVIE